MLTETNTKTAQIEASSVTGNASASPNLKVIDAHAPRVEVQPAHPGLTGSSNSMDAGLFSDHGASLENGELFQSYLLIQNLLYHSWMEIKRQSTRKAEVEFWRSRRADFYVYLSNLHRECMDMSPIHADTYRKGIAAQLGMESDWLFATDNMSEAEVEEFCEDYMVRWRQLSEANPEGVNDPAAEALFEPNLALKKTTVTVRKRRAPVPLEEYRVRRQQSKPVELTEEQLEFPLDVTTANELEGMHQAEPSESIAMDAASETAITFGDGMCSAPAKEKVTPQDLFGPSLQEAQRTEPPPAVEASAVEASAVEAPAVEASAVEASAVEASAVEASAVEASAEVLSEPCVCRDHPLFRRQASREDVQKYSSKPRFRTQWVTLG